MPFYGLVELSCRVKNMDATETFLISPCKDVAILEMPLLGAT